MENHLLLALGVWLATAGAGPLSYADDSTSKGLTRSIYVPVHFAVDEGVRDHLRVWIEQEEGKDILLSISPHTFIFTYFPGPDDRGLHPEHVEMRLQAEQGCLGAVLDTSLIITPLGIVSPGDTVAFDIQKLNEHFRRGRRVLRLPSTLIRIKCPDTEPPAWALQQPVRTRARLQADDLRRGPSTSLLTPTRLQPVCRASLLRVTGFLS